MRKFKTLLILLVIVATPTHVKSYDCLTSCDIACDFIYGGEKPDFQGWLRCLRDCYQRCLELPAE